MPSISLLVSGVPPPWKPKKPLGETVIEVPVEALTESILLETASRAMSIEIERAMATPKIMTTPTERMMFRNAFRTPRRIAFTGSSPFGITPTVTVVS